MVDKEDRLPQVSGASGDDRGRVAQLEGLVVEQVSKFLWFLHATSCTAPRLAAL